MESEGKVAENALSKFKSGNYEKSLLCLTELSSLKPNDYKISHNKSVVEFYSSGLTNVDAFQKAINLISSQHHINMTDGPEDVEHCIVLYNQAIIFYLQKQFDKALTLTEKVYSLIQPMDEYLARKVCLLLIELTVLNKNVKRALALMSQIEDQFLSTESKTLMFDKEVEEEEKPAPRLDEATEAFRISFLHLRARAHLLEGAWGLARKDLDTVYGAKKQGFGTVLLRAQLELLQGRYREAEAALIVVQENLAWFASLDPPSTFLYYNSMAVIQHNLSRPGLSKFFIMKGFSVFRAARQKYAGLSPKEVVVSRPSVFAPPEALKFLYNVGVALLYGGSPLQAFDYLMEAAQVTHTSPRTWLRLAECCVMLYRKDNKHLFDFFNRRSELALGTIGAGCFKKIILNNQLYKDSSYSCEPQSYAVPVASLEFGSLCVRNALQLLPKRSSKLRQAVLAISAYIHLTIGDFVQALHHSTALLEDETCSDLYKYLGRLYKGEALVFLDRISEAVDLLNPTTFRDLEPSLEPLLHEWQPRSKAAALTVLQYNLATVLCIQGEFDRSADILRHIWVSRGTKGEIPIQVIALALYIELVIGHVDIAKTIIKQNCPQVT